MKYYIIAGEASGDLHGSNLIKELKRQDPNTTVRCWGGDLMQQAGGELVKHYKDLAFMGFAEIVMNLRTILRNLEFCKQDILHYRPDALILVDYPGFNMRIAKWARHTDFASRQPDLHTSQDNHPSRPHIIYYISPQVWAWKEGRVRQIRETVDKMLVILPFEKAFYKKWNYDVEYVGHPLVEEIDSFLANPALARAPILQSSQPIIALLPGSRKQEIEKKLPIMLEASRHFPDYQFVVAQAPGQEPAFYDKRTSAYPNVGSVRNATYALLSQARAAFVTSGTATLETALFGVPEIVCYKGSSVSYQIARRLIKVKYISLVNLIMDKPVVKELIQDELTADNLHRELEALLADNSRRQQLREDYRNLKELLSQGGHASANAAASILRFLAPTHAATT